MTRGGPAGAALCALALLAGTGRLWGDPVGEATVPLSLGVPLFSHPLGAGRWETPADGVGLSEFPGAGAFVEPYLRLGLNLQFTEKPGSAPGDGFEAFGILPQVNLRFTPGWFASLVPSFYPFYGGRARFAFAVQGVVTRSEDFAGAWSVFEGVELPVFLVPERTLGCTPILGVSRRLD